MSDNSCFIDNISLNQLIIKNDNSISNNYTLNEASSEQLSIINNLSTHNIFVDSCAGAGKTTTVLHVGRRYKEHNILLLTYNAKLKLETRDKINKLSLSNVEAHSYHSFCVKYYDNTCYTDKPLKELLLKKKNPLKKFKYTMIILDEAQDITPLYYSLICKIFADNDMDFCSRILVLGDKYQSIYGFNKANYRYLTFSEQLYNFNAFNWQKKTLNITYRIHKENVRFINKCMLSNDRIVAIKSGLVPRYLICDCYNTNINYKPYKELIYYLKKGFGYNEIFILAPSVKSEQSPIRILANCLSRANIPIFVPHNDEEKLDSQILENKIVFATYHQTKGLERKVVIIFNFDSSYFKYYNRNCDPNICPNELYVAVTRSIERLTLIHHNTNNYLQFLNENNLSEYCDCDIENFNIYNCPSLSRTTNLHVIDLTRHLSMEIIEKATSFFTTHIINKSGSLINIPIKTKQGNLWENVSDINGIAIPAYFELKNNNKMRISECICRKKADNNYMFLNDSSDDDDESDDIIKNISIETITPELLLQVANKWNSEVSGYIFKLKQIKNYNWLSEENLEMACSRIKKYISNNSLFEVFYNIENKPELYDKKILGIIDCIDDTKIWEFKCVKELNHIHQIQLAIYMYMVLMKNEKIGYTFYLFNILNENIIEIKSDLQQLKSMIKFLIYEKYFAENTDNDITFILSTTKIRDKYSQQ